MPTNATIDRYANYCLARVVESGANTLTFAQIQTGISLFDKVAWVINRIEWSVDIVATDTGADNDYLNYGLSTSNSWTTPSIMEQTILDFNSLILRSYSQVGVEYQYQPLVKDFSQLPGGGILAPPTPLFVWAKGNGLGSAQTVTARMMYTVLSLKPEEYWELVESRRVITT